MENDYQDPPVHSRRGRVSTAIALVLLLLVLGAIAWFSAENWTPDEPLRRPDHGFAPAPARAIA